MSEGLREGSPLDKHRGEDAITEFDRRVFQSLAKSMWLPDDFKEYMTQYLALNQPPIPVGQLFGFTQFTFQPATTINAAEATTSTSYTDLATTGPLLTGLSDGSYALFFGAQIGHSGTGSAIISLEVNGVAATDDDCCVATTSMNTSRLVLKDLDADGNNTVTVKYRSADGSSQSFTRRWLIAVRYANL